MLEKKTTFLIKKLMHLQSTSLFVSLNYASVVQINYKTHTTPSDKYHGAEDKENERHHFRQDY